MIERRDKSLEPLDIVDDRTPEQILADGDAYWPDGQPYVPPNGTQQEETTKGQHVYEINERVYLRRNTAQYGRIGYSADGSCVYDWYQGTIVQPVFWDSPGSDVHTWEKTEGLMGEEEMRERRRLFFSVMRRADMHILRAALAYIRAEIGEDWQSIESLEIDWVGETGRETWMLTTEKWLLINYVPHVDPGEFSNHRLHVDGDLQCECGFCFKGSLIA